MTSRWSLPPRRAGHDPPEDVLERRAQAATLPGDARPGVPVAETTIADVQCIVCGLERTRPVVVYLHGGAYRVGKPGGWVAFGTALADVSDACVVIVDYALAPEQPFPAALHDVAAVVDALIDGDHRVVLAGDSAGGGLAAAVTGAAADSVPLAGLCLISPWLDLTVSAGTYDSRATTDELFSADSARQAAALYLQGHDARDPLASPLFADVRHFPATVVFAGGHEVLLDDALTFAQHLARAGVSVDLHVRTGMQHVWPLLFPDLDESKWAVRVIGEFVRDVAGT
jgi:acetyl esterase/lipase